MHELRRRGSALFLLLSVLFWPEISLAQAVQAATPPQSTSAVVPPQPIGVHNASAYYPQIDQLLNREGSVTLRYSILANGSVSDPTVVVSSGYPELDVAALTAVMTWRYKPATRDGVPVPVPWETRVDFKLDDLSMPSFVPSTVVNMPVSAYPAAALSEQKSGDCLLLITLSETGSVLNIVVDQSSGSPELDKASVAIVADQWHFVPASHDGTPMKSIVMVDAKWTLPATIH